MKKYLILIAPLLFLLSGCAIFSSNITFTPVDGLSDVKISSRSTPAKISNESDKIIETKGYAYIGFVRLEDEVKACWDKECQNFECTASLPHQDMTKKVLEKAAAEGGDLLVLGLNVKPEISSTRKEGKCIGWTDTYVQVPYCCKSGRGYCESTCYRSERRSVCSSWSSIYGRKCSFITDGKVWRQDPQLIKDLARIKEEKKLKLAEIEREKKFPRKFEVMKKTYEANIPKALKERISIRGPSAIKVGDKYGFQEAVWSKKIIIAPQYTDVLHGFSEGLAAVAIGEKDKKLWGFIDNTGQWVIRPSYGDASKFYEGLASVKENNKYGYIDKKGNFIIKPQFDAAYSFIEGMAKVKVGNKEGYVNKLGEVFMEP
jgi:hypothetical protein